MDAATFYSGEAEYLLETRTLLAENGNQVLKALRTPGSNYEGPQTAAAGFAPIPEVDLHELSGFSSGSGSTTQSSSSSGSMADLSGHVRVTNPNGDIEEYYMSVTPHLLPLDNSSSAAKGGVAQQAAAGDQPSGSENAWIALDVDQFYVTEDETGEEIWPVTIPAQSLSNPEQIIEVTVHGDGRLEWPEEALNNGTNSSTKSLAFSLDPELNYLSSDPIAIRDPGTGGSGGSGGGSTSAANVTLDQHATEMEIVDNAGFLALKSIRLHDRSESGSASEIFMHMGYGDESAKPKKLWTYSFDEKRGRFGQKNGFFSRVFEGVKMALLNGARDKITGNGFSFEPSIIVNALVEPVATVSPLFDGKNKNTIGADMAVYEVPDINQEGVTYTFENMKKWNLPIFQRRPSNTPLYVAEDIHLTASFELSDLNADYFPIIPLYQETSNNKWKLMLSEDDKRKEKFTTRKFFGNERTKKMWVFDMATGRYNFENFTVETDWHWFGGSDDFVERSNVKNITTPNIFQRTLYNNEIVTRKDNQKIIYTIAECEVLCTR